MDKLAAERILVADVHGDTLAGDVERRLIRRTGRLISERDVEHSANEPSNHGFGGNGFSERDKMPLAVPLSWRGAYAYDTVEVVIFVRARAARLEEKKTEQ